MSKIIQSAYSAIESQKYKKAASLLESPDVARFPLAKVYYYLIDYNFIVFERLLLCSTWKPNKSKRKYWRIDCIVNLNGIDIVETETNGYDCNSPSNGLYSLC